MTDSVEIFNGKSGMIFDRDELDKSVTTYGQPRMEDWRPKRLRCHAFPVVDHCRNRPGTVSSSLASSKTPDLPLKF